MSNIVEIYTDGACRGNPGPGGWGVYLNYKGNTRSLYGGEDDTTNNRMELTAAIKALEALTRRCSVVLHTDSTYLRNGVLQWLAGWQSKGWKTAAGKPVKNQDLWQQLADLITQHDIEWVWVKAHVGIEGNELADQLANQGIDELES